MRARLIQLLAAILVGILLGGASISVVMGVEIDRLYLANKALEEQLRSTENELAQVKESIAAHKRRVVTGIQPHISFPEEKSQITSYEQGTAQLLLEKRIKEWLEVLQGQEIESMNYEIVPKIVDNREFEVNGNKFVLEVKLVVIKEKVEIFVDAALIPGKSGE
ncbi:MAG: hypothetical protein AB1815_09815 [Bacillota bacterium]|jgi:hypothetical protein